MVGRRRGRWARFLLPDVDEEGAKLWRGGCCDGAGRRGRKLSLEAGLETGDDNVGWLVASGPGDEAEDMTGCSWAVDDEGNGKRGGGGGGNGTPMAGGIMGGATADGVMKNGLTAGCGPIIVWIRFSGAGGKMDTPPGGKCPPPNRWITPGGNPGGRRGGPTCAAANRCIVITGVTSVPAVLAGWMLLGVITASSRLGGGNAPPEPAPFALTSVAWDSRWLLSSGTESYRSKHT